MSNGLFRSQAVRSNLDPDERGGLLRARPTSGWLAFVVLAAVLVIALGIGVTQRAPVALRGRGVIGPDRRPVVVRAPIAGVVSGELPAVGGQVTAGETLVVAGEPVTAPIDGAISQWLVQTGDSVRAGDELVHIAPKGTRLIGRLTLPARERGRIVIGAPVLLRLGDSPDDDSPGSAQVLSVMESGTDGELSVELQLTSPPAGVDAFRARMAFTGELVLRQERLLVLLFPPLGAWLP